MTCRISNRSYDDNRKAVKIREGFIVLFNASHTNCNKAGIRPVMVELTKAVSKETAVQISKVHLQNI